MDKTLIAIIGALIIGAGVYFGVQYFQKPAEPAATTAKVDNFEECVAAKYPVAGALSQICTAPNGRIFMDNIGNAAEMLDQIKISQPKPNRRITSPTTVIGDARGTWFFEAQFPVIVQDADGNELGRGTARAYSDWMTENFVPFDATFEFGVPATETGFLILKKDNPSGLPENDAELKIPIRFK